MKGFTLIEVMIIVAIVGILIAVGVGAVVLKGERERFIASCMQQEPQYQCEVKWKQMRPDRTVVYVQH